MSKHSTHALAQFLTLVLVTGLAGCVARPVAEHTAPPASARMPAAVDEARMAPQAPLDLTPITPVESAGAAD
jgi:hypothetical protein